MQFDRSEELKTGLYLVPTPIGNLEDITIRALKVISSADILCCEDTRHTGILLKHYNIYANRLESYHEHNEKEKSNYLIDEIERGNSLALVTDAGSPGISDPAFRLVKAAIEKGVTVYPLPGATAFVPALTASGMPVSKFKFFGFPPQKKGRSSFIKALAEEDCTMILYESPYRIPRLLLQLSDSLGNDRQICIAREISKIHEEFIRGTISDCLNYMKESSTVKGEFVVVIEGKEV
jgi:16S rRNA (cytidine1402-2'-O)-methyltransferase